MVGQSIRIKLPGVIRKGEPTWSEPVRVTEVHRSCVRVEGGGLWNLRRIAVCPRHVAVCPGGVGGMGKESNEKDWMITRV